jgi:hypothetical protein
MTSGFHSGHNLEQVCERKSISMLATESVLNDILFGEMSELDCNKLRPHI